MPSERFSRLRLLLGDDGLTRLSHATVMVIGLGGVGSSCVQALARGGVGSLILLDRDVIEESNINRQALAFLSTVGKPKVEAMCAMVRDINPDCSTLSQQIFLTGENVATILQTYPRPDYVIDCIDTVTQKLAIAQWCAEREVPLLSSMGAANKLDPCSLQFADIHDTQRCPLSRAMRRECRNRGITRLDVLFSSEIAAKVNPDGTRSKRELLGSMSYMPPIMGQMLAGLVIRRLAGLEALPPPPLMVQPHRQVCS